MLNSRGELLSNTPLLTRQQTGNSIDFNSRRGLNSFELHPDFANRDTFGYGKAYAVVSQNASGSGELGSFGGNHDSVLVEYDLSATNFIGNTRVIDGAAASAPRELLRVAQSGPSHNGFDIAFRPDNNQLYFSVGDGTANSFNDDNGQRLQLAQDLDSVYGSVLRINPDVNAANSTVSANGQYSIPDDNPFVGETARTGNAALGEIYANGFRSPFRISVDPNNPDQVILGDVGNGSREEINIVIAGGNYGWGQREGSIGVNQSLINVQADGSLDLLGPEFEYGRSGLADTGTGAAGGGLAVIAGFVYEGLGYQDTLLEDFEVLTDQVLGAELGAFFGQPSNARVYFGTPDGDLTNGSQEVAAFQIANSDIASNDLNQLGLPGIIIGLVEGFNGEIFVFGLDESNVPGADEGDELPGFLTVAALVPEGSELPAVAAVVGVPEPSGTLVLLALGLSAVVRRQRRLS